MRGHTRMLVCLPRMSRDVMFFYADLISSASIPADVLVAEGC